MSAGKFLHIAINFKGGPTKTDELEPTFDKGLDWVRYAPNCWIVWTTSPPEKWYARLKSALHEDDTFLISEINLENRSGWLPKTVWNWINKERD